jgi:hypothetical protein
MKNLYLLPTDQPSRLVKIKDTFFLTTTNDIPGGTFYNIYITSDEEIKQGDWCLNANKDTIYKKDKYPMDISWDKIILSTDPTLITDGVQAIDDEFLLWFVKNPNCEFVEVKEKSPNEIEKELGIYGHDIGLTENEYSEWLKNGGQLYKIIIPQEEPKEEMRMYSEGEVYELLCHFFDDHVNAQNANIEQWFEQNKKK